jgi:hypothetical protein
MEGGKKMRKQSYKLGRTLGDIKAISSGKPEKILKRILNKLIGRFIVSKLWFK